MVVVEVGESEPNTAASAADPKQEGGEKYEAPLPEPIVVVEEASRINDQGVSLPGEPPKSLARTCHFVVVFSPFNCSNCLRFLCRDSVPVDGF